VSVVTDDSDSTATAALGAWVVDVDRGAAPALMKLLIDRASASGQDVLVCRRDMVFGRDHVASALEHAMSAMREGRNVSASLPMETLLYLSGERQLSGAIGKMTVGDDTTQVVVAQLSTGPSVREFSWTDLPRVDPEIGAERLLVFGISETELKTVGSDRGAELVLERVAAVDVLKR
jgi:KEOPS complex subunit Cgi121